MTLTDDIARDGLMLTDDDCVRLHAKLMQLEAERAQACSENLKLRMAIGLVLDIAEQSAVPAHVRTCALTRECLGEPPKRGTRPKIVSSNDGSAA